MSMFGNVGTAPLWSTTGSTMDSRLSPRLCAQHTTNDAGLTFIGSVSGDLARLQDEVTGLHGGMERLREAFLAEARARSGEVASLQSKLFAEQAGVLDRMQKDLDSRLSGFEESTTKWVHKLCQDVQGIKPRLENVEIAVPQHVNTQALHDGRLAKLEQALPAMMRSLNSLDEKHSTRAIEIERTLCTQGEQATSKVRAIATNNAADIKRLEESVEALHREEQAQKTTLSVNVQTVESLADRVRGMQVTMQTKATTAALEALQAKVTGIIDQTLHSMREEMDRKESVATVKALASHLSSVEADVRADAAQAKAEAECLCKRISETDQCLAKLANRAEAERGRLLFLEREIFTKSAKADVEALTTRTKADLTTLLSKHASLEVALEVPTAAAREANDAAKKLQSRAVAIEESLNQKANAAELPRLQMQVAEHAAKHACFHAVGHEHASRLEQSRSVAEEHRTRLEVLEHRERDLQVQLAQRTGLDPIKTQEMIVTLLKEHYRREDIDAMMTRVWWRIGDPGKSSPKSALPQLPHAVKR